eukprot:TRINITY_DN336_c1_g1_i2.p4 TRINITY_DN336_c1_g1~~TRINITY_DN336_c1_g1_i2.p4  ORF type:complete len:126 (+),score=7.37 TRINITY_DN336_c1_g1_i2:422-799(+)
MFLFLFLGKFVLFCIMILDFQLVRIATNQLCLVLRNGWIRALVKTNFELNLVKPSPENYVLIFVSGKICSFLYNDIGLLIGQNCNKLIVLSFEKWMDCDRQKKLVVMFQWVFVGCFDFSFLGFMA